MITATPSVVLKNVSGLHVSSRLAADVTKLKLWVPSRKRCRCVFFFDKPTAFAPFKRGVEFCSCFVRSSSTTVLTVKVFTLGGWRWGGDLCSLCHVLRKAILTLSLVTEWMMKKKKMGSQMKWGEDDDDDGGGSVWWGWEVEEEGEGVCVLPMEMTPPPPAPPPKKNNLTCHFSADTRCLDGVNRKGVCVLWNVFVCVCGVYWD